MGFRMPDNLFDGVYASLWRPHEPYGPTFFSSHVESQNEFIWFSSFFLFSLQKGDRL